MPANHKIPHTAEARAKMRKSHLGTAATTVHGRAGMSLRDYFATHCELGDPDNYSVQFGESLLGRLLPALGRVEQLTWWADYRAAMRYLEADAMLRASEKGGAA